MEGLGRAPRGNMGLGLGAPRAEGKPGGKTEGTAAYWTEATAACYLGTAAAAWAAGGTASSVAAGTAASLPGGTGASTEVTASASAAGRETGEGGAAAAEEWNLSCPGLPSWLQQGGSLKRRQARGS